MTRAWIFQANPDRYDIDAALQELSTIRWQVPQYTGEILPGDVVALWRSGREAGIVGLARVTQAPREAPSTPAEQQFFRDEGDAGAVSTMATLRASACPLVPKDTVAAVPQLAGHQIITAPRATVFALTGEQWAALAPLLPEPPPAAEVQEPTAWPAPFSWEERAKSVNPLPGGMDAYQDVLREILGQVESTEPARDELDEWTARRYDVSLRRGSLTIGFLGRSGLLRVESSRVRLTPDALRWMHERDAGFLLAVVHARIRYLGELLAYLDTPRTTEELLRHANERYAMHWATRGQIVRRRHLLGGLGMVELDDEDRLRRTTFGGEVLSRLELAAPRVIEADHGEPAGVAAPASTREPLVAAPAPSPVAEAIVARLLETAHDSANPDAFEQAARDAFAFLGFDAVWYGGAGRTDVMLTAPLGAGEQYRVVVDTKSTAHEAVSDSQIDWVTLDEHQARYDADYAAVVAPAFRGGRVADRARRDRSIALLTVSTLADVIRQHETAPLDLDAYRGLFDPEIGAEDVLEQADVFRRQVVLAAEIVRQVDRLANEEGVVTPGDLYWNLEAFAEQFEGQRAEREEIREVCEALARPPLSLLRAVDGGYAPPGSQSTTARRLRLLADLVERGSPETAG